METHSVIIITVLVGLLGIAGGFLASNLTMGRAISKLAERIGSLETALAHDQKRTDERFASLDAEKNRILTDAFREHDRQDRLLQAHHGEFKSCQKHCQERSEAYVRHDGCLENLCRDMMDVKKEVAGLRDLILEGRS